MNNCMYFQSPSGNHNKSLYGDLIVDTKNFIIIKKCEQPLLIVIHISEINSEVQNLCTILYILWPIAIMQKNTHNVRTIWNLINAWFVLRQFMSYFMYHSCERNTKISCNTIFEPERLTTHWYVLAVLVLRLFPSVPAVTIYFFCLLALFNIIHKLFSRNKRETLSLPTII